MNNIIDISEIINKLKIYCKRYEKLKKWLLRKGIKKIFKDIKELYESYELQYDSKIKNKFSNEIINYIENSYKEFKLFIKESESSPEKITIKQYSNEYHNLIKKAKEIISFSDVAKTYLEKTVLNHVTSQFKNSKDFKEFSDSLKKLSEYEAALIQEKMADLKLTKHYRKMEKPDITNKSKIEKLRHQIEKDEALEKELYNYFRRNASMIWHIVKDHIKEKKEKDHLVVFKSAKATFQRLRVVKSKELLMIKKRLAEKRKEALEKLSKKKISSKEIEEVNKIMKEIQNIQEEYKNTCIKEISETKRILIEHLKDHDFEVTDEVVEWLERLFKKGKSKINETAKNDMHRN